MMSSSEGELSRISAEIRILTIKRQQLPERKSAMCFLDELKSRLQSREEAAGETISEAQRREIDSIDIRMKQLTERKAQLERSQNTGGNKSVAKTVSFGAPPEPQTVYVKEIYVIKPPPPTPPPTVILDPKKFPACPCKTRCPQCEQFVTTETFARVSSFTWLACLLIAIIGCVAGCCLIPFFLNIFKSTTHRCPRCRTIIGTTKKF